MGREDEPASTPEESYLDQRYAELVQMFIDTPGVSAGSGRRGFGTDALQVDGHIFAMARRGGLVVKLPADRVDELIADGIGEPFDAGKGKPMREWIVINPRSAESWPSLAHEALAFVGGRSSPRTQLP